MSVLSIIKLVPDNYDCVGTCLRVPANDIKVEDLKSSWLKQLISDMFETLYSNSSGVGLAANQVAVLLRICVIDIKRDAKNPLVLINPSYIPIGEGKHHSSEVCLSFPGVASEVERYDKVEVSYLALDGTVKTITAEGFKSDVFQHEIDHLNGIVQIDRLCDRNAPEPYIGYNKKMANKAIDKLWSVDS